MSSPSSPAVRASVRAAVAVALMLRLGQTGYGGCSSQLEMSNAGWRLRVLAGYAYTLDDAIPTAT